MMGESEWVMEIWGWGLGLKIRGVGVRGVKSKEMFRQRN
jgi:hypothetical protein